MNKRLGEFPKGITKYAKIRNYYPGDLGVSISVEQNILDPIFCEQGSYVGLFSWIADPLEDHLGESTNE